jgi:hypothetical protein
MSGRVRDQFAACGWESWSADILPCEVPSEEHAYPDGRRTGNLSLIAPGTHHYQGDVRDLFKWDHPVNRQRRYFMRKADEQYGYETPLWDLILAHPPCDHISYAGARWFKLKQEDGRQEAALNFFGEMLDAPSPLVAVENPHSIAQVRYGKPTQVVQPYFFGDPYEKQIHLWLKGLPELWPDAIVTPTGRVTTGGGSWRTDKAAQRKAMSAYEDSEGRINRAKVRSRTMPGLARALAEQWGPYAEHFYALNLHENKPSR